MTMEVKEQQSTTSASLTGAEYTDLEQWLIQNDWYLLKGERQTPASPMLYVWLAPIGQVLRIIIK